jgi:hypothetical protein
MSNLNIAAVKRHALACSEKHRAGKFTRVGADFLTECDADVEALVRELRNKYANQVHVSLETEEYFLTPALVEKLTRELNAAIGRLIQNKVQRQPSVGQTMGRTH